jgi:hypothetical protein
MDEIMPGGRFSKPVRRGLTVERTAASENVHALLRHFEVAGLTLTPRYLGLTEDGTREILTFVDGETGYPPLSADQRSDEALVSVARAIRAIHDASQGFLAPDPDGWAGYEVAVPAVIDCIGHHDLAPWNIAFHGTEVTGIIDWDSARPSNRGWDLSYAAHQFVPLHPTDDLPAWGWDTEPDRRRRMRLLAASYGRGIEPAEVLDLLIVRLAAMAAHIEAQIRAGDPDFAAHRAEDHGSGYRKAVRYLVDNRTALIDAPRP